MTVNFGTMNPYMMSSVDMDNIMNAPILSSGMGMTNPMMMGTGIGGYAGLGTFGGVLNPQYQMQTIQQWDDFGVNRQVAAFRNQNNAQFQMQAQNGSIQRQVQILAQEIKANNQDNVKTEYTKLLQAIKTAYGSQLQGTDEEKELTLKQYADQIYAQQTGTYMTEDLKANGRGSFGDGFMKIFSFGMGNKTSVEENLEMMTGVKQTTGSKASNVCGKILGTICTLGLGWLGNL